MPVGYDRLHVLGQVHQAGSMRVECFGAHRLGEQIGLIQLGVDVLHVYLARVIQLTYLEVAAIDVTRPVTRLAIARELDCT